MVENKPSTSSLVTQRIHDQLHGHFHKERLTFPSTGGPLVMTRKRSAQRPSRAAILLVHGFGQNRYSWHLPQRSFVNYLAEAGYDVFNLELRGHGRSRQAGSRQARSFEEYAHQDLPRAVQVALQASQQEKIFLFGHSLGGATIYSAAHTLAPQLRGIVTFAGVFRYGLGLPVVRAIEWLSRFALPKVAGKPLPLQWIAQPLLPSLTLAEPFLHAARLSPWAKDSFERPVLEEYLSRSFDRASFDVLSEVFSWLRRGEFQDAAKEETFFSVKAPLLVLSGSRDHLNHPSGVKPAFEGSQSKDKTYLELSKESCGVHFGHVDLLIGKHAPHYVWPLVREWLDQR